MPATLPIRWRVGILVLLSSSISFAIREPTTRAVDGWILPAAGLGALPIYGIDGGISIGLDPAPGPRGLIRIYAPYLDQPLGRVINYIAIEPIVAGKRYFSELARSGTDGRRGILFHINGAPTFARTKGGVPTMQLSLRIDPFAEGARPTVEVIFQQDRPHEITFRISAAPGSVDMDACILTATMGNYSRLRRLMLKDEVVEASKLWPGFDAHEPGVDGFSPHRRWSLDRLTIRNNQAEVSATSDEPNPEIAAYAFRVPIHWYYEGKPAIQTWRSAPVKGLVARVNGRCVYWGTRSPIPGGIAFENFELEAPFAEGQEFTFAVEPIAR
jgi:hypothetical protein